MGWGSGEGAKSSPRRRRGASQGRRANASRMGWGSGEGVVATAPESGAERRKPYLLRYVAESPAAGAGGSSVGGVSGAAGSAGFAAFFRLRRGFAVDLAGCSQSFIWVRT